MAWENRLRDFQRRYGQIEAEVGHATMSTVMKVWLDQPRQRPGCMSFGMLHLDRSK
jgi:hypothetical protein